MKVYKHNMQGLFAAIAWGVLCSQMECLYEGCSMRSMPGERALDLAWRLPQMHRASTSVLSGICIRNSFIAGRGSSMVCCLALLYCSFDGIAWFEQMQVQMEAWFAH